MRSDFYLKTPHEISIGFPNIRAYLWVNSSISISMISGRNPQRSYRLLRDDHHVGTPIIQYNGGFLTKIVPIRSYSYIKFIGESISIPFRVFNFTS